MSKNDGTTEQDDDEHDRLAIPHMGIAQRGFYLVRLYFLSLL